MRTNETGWVPDDWDLDVAAAVKNELLLLDSKVRAKRDAVSDLLHEDFVEFGSSGRMWNHRDAVMGLEKNPGDGALEAHNVRAARLGTDTVLLTYAVHVPGQGASLKSSVWRRDGQSWRLFFHQGTPSQYLD
jgi:ribonuclease HI